MTIATLPVECALGEHQPRTIRASSPSAPSGVASSGLISISAISGCSAATRESAAAARGGGADVHRRPAAGAVQKRRHPERAQERLGGGLGHRRERDGDVLDDLRVETARADEQDGPEARVALGADDQLEPGGERRHRLDRVRGRVERRLHPLERLVQLRRVAETDGDAAGVRLVQLAERLEHDRVADLGGDGDGLLETRHAPGRGEVDAGGRRAPRATRSSPARPRAAAPAAAARAPARSASGVRRASRDATPTAASTSR